jgi:WD40 repeat protein
LVPEKELPGHSGAVTTLHALGRQLLSGGADGTVRLWDVEKAQTTVHMAHGGPVTAVAIRPDGKRFASAGDNKLAKLWDAAGKPIAELKGNRYLVDAADTRDRDLQIATGTVAFHNAAVKAAETQLAGAKEHTKKVVADLPAKQLDVETKQKALADARTTKDAADQALATAEAELKKAEDGFQAADKLAQQTKTEAEAAKTRTPPDQAAIAKATADAATRAQEVAKAKAERDQREAQRKQAADKLAPAMKALTDAEQGAKQSEAARRQAIHEVDTAVKDEEKFTTAIPVAKAALDVAENARKKADTELQAAKQKAAEAEQPIHALAFSPDNLLLVTGGADQEARAWSAEIGVPADVLSGHKATLTSLAFTSAGELIAAAADRSVATWHFDVAWKLERVIGSADGASPFIDRIGAVTFSHDGKLIATGGGEPSRGGEIKLWNPATGELVRDISDVHSDAVLSLDFSRDNLLLLSGAADRMARIVDVATGKQTRSFEGHSHHVLGVSWSPDGRTIATAGADNTVKIWDVATGDRKKNIEGAEKEVTAVRFIGTGDKILSSSGDNKVRLVKPDGGQILAFGDISDFVNTAAATANGKIVLAGGYDSILRVWNGIDGKPLGSFAAEKK